MGAHCPTCGVIVEQGRCYRETCVLIAQRGRRGTISDEQHRILRAAEEGRLAVNEHHRYTITGEPRPARKDRERLFKRGFLAWDGSPFITEAGRQILASKDGK